MIKLPFSPPPIKGFLNYAYQLGILVNYPETEHWILQNYIQLLGDKKNAASPIQFYMPDSSGYNWSPSCPFFNELVIDRKLIDNYNIDITRLVKEQIKAGFYIFCHINERYIPETPYFRNQQDYNHCILLFGYEDESNGEELIFAGYDINRRFKERRVKVTDFKNAYYSNQYNYPMESRLYMWEVREDFDDLQLDINLHEISKQLRNYLDSKCNSNNIINYDNKLSLTFGIETYDLIVQYLQNVHLFEDKSSRDIPLHIMLEHKRMMLKRFEYLEKYMTGGVFSSPQKKYEEIENKLINYRTYLTKLLLTGRTDQVHSLIEGVQLLKELDRDAIAESLQIIDSYMKKTTC